MITTSLRRVARKLRKVPAIIREEGIHGIIWRTKSRLWGDYYLTEFQRSYEQWYAKNAPSLEKLRQQKALQSSFQNKPLISILTPTYNTNPRFLRECIESVLAQSYTNWELCIVDDASTDSSVHEVLASYENHPQIKIKYRKKNGHICAASNDALTMAAGEWIALLDHDDYLWPNALFEVVAEINKHPSAKFIYSDEDKLTEDSSTHREPFFKPDWSPHFLWSCNYITHFAVLKTSLVKEVGGFTMGSEGAQDWDLFLKVIDHLDGYDQHPWMTNCAIRHISTIIYSWRISASSTSSHKHAQDAKSYAFKAQKVVLQNALDRHEGATIRQSRYIGIWEVIPTVSVTPLVSIIIPTKDNSAYLRPCLESIFSKTSYQHFEVIIVDTGSTNNETQNVYDQYKNNIRVVSFDKKPFNYSATMNFGVSKAKGEYLLFLNDDTMIISPSWIQEMLSYAQLDEVGAVGCRLLYPDGTIQHTGLVVGHENSSFLGERGFVSNYFRQTDPRPNYGISSLLMDTIRDYSAVTAACMLIRANKYTNVGGFDESLAIAFNDVDLCLKLSSKHLYNVVLPQVKVQHAESVSLGNPETRKRDLQLFISEVRKMKSKWEKRVNQDAFLSENLTLINGKLQVEA